MTIPAVMDDHNLKSLRSLVDKIVACMRSLDSLQIPLYTLSSIIAHITKSKLPDTWKLGWARSIHENTGDLSSMLTYLQKEIELREDAACPMQSFAGPSRTQEPRSSHYPVPSV